jgi:hypothetical protein
LHCHFSEVPSRDGKEKLDEPVKEERGWLSAQESKQTLDDLDFEFDE